MHLANSGLDFKQQLCRAVEDNVITTVVAFDAIPFIRHGAVWEHDQYAKVSIQRELRKCMVAVRAPFGYRQRNFVTGNWGCGCFRGDIELKYMIQWICSSIEPSVANIVFCPFDQGDFLKKAGFLDLIKKYEGKVSVNSVLHALAEDPAYMDASTTIRYLLLKLFASWPDHPTVEQFPQPWGLPCQSGNQLASDQLALGSFRAELIAAPSSSESLPSV